LKPSPSFRTPGSAFGDALGVGDRLTILASVLLFVLHPDLYLYGRDIVLRLAAHYEGTEFDHCAAPWRSPFSVISGIFNHETPLHNDPEPPAGWLDVLMTLGEYETTLLKAETVGLLFDYRPGTVMALMCSRVWHGVSPVMGDRLSLLFYFKQYIGAYFGKSTYPKATYLETTRS
jgi:hypothetical protein